MIEKSVPWDHSLVMQNGDTWDGFFYPALTLMIDSYLSYLILKVRYFVAIAGRNGIVLHNIGKLHSGKSVSI